MTLRQEEILKFIYDFIDSNGFPPSYREIGSHFNISSTFGVKRHLDALTKKGYINIDSKTNRSISLTEISLSKFNSNKENNSIEIPILGRVAAGYPILSEENTGQHWAKPGARQFFTLTKHEPGAGQATVRVERAPGGKHLRIDSARCRCSIS